MTWLDVALIGLGVAGYFAAAMLVGVVVGQVCGDPYRHRSRGPLDDVEARRQERDAERVLYPHASKRRR